MGGTLELIRSGARVHQAGCMGCIGMGQAPAVGTNSLRTFPRNFPGRSGTPDDQVWLCSPETAAAAALTGQITDPRQLPDLLGLGVAYPALDLPATSAVNTTMLEPLLPPGEAWTVELVKAPSIGTLPELDPLPDTLLAPVVIKVGDDVSTDEILPAGAQALPYRSNITKLADFAFAPIDPATPSGPARPGSTSSSAAPTTGRAPPANTPPSPPDTSASARSRPSHTPASTGRT